MKARQRWQFGQVVAALLFSGVLCAEEPQWTLRSELLVFRMLLNSDGLRMRDQLSDSTRIGPAIAQLMTRVNEGAAELIGIAMNTTTVSNGSADRDGSDFGPYWNETDPASQCVEEVPTPKDFIIAHPPQNFEPKIPTLEDEFWLAYYIPTTIDVPVDFDSWYVGVTLDVQGRAVNGNQLVDLALVAQNVAYLGGQIPSDEETANWRHRLPRFRTHKVSMQLKVKSGDWELLSVNVVNENKPSLEFMIFRVTAIPAEG